MGPCRVLATNCPPVSGWVFGRVSSGHGFQEPGWSCRFLRWSVAVWTAEPRAMSCTKSTRLGAEAGTAIGPVSAPRQLVARVGPGQPPHLNSMARADMGVSTCPRSSPLTSPCPYLALPICGSGMIIISSRVLMTYSLQCALQSSGEGGCGRNATLFGFQISRPSPRRPVAPCWDLSWLLLVGPGA